MADGRLDEPGWDNAARTQGFVAPGSGAPNADSQVNAHALLAWSEQGLMLAFVVYEPEPSSSHDRDAVDPHIWEASSGVELMLQPGDPGDNTHYYEVQVDVHEAVWDTRFDDYNRPITEGVNGREFGHQGWSAQLERGAHVDAEAGSYTIEMMLPWSALDAATLGETANPPQAGDVWRANLYTFRDGQRDALAWSATMGEGNFHYAPRFGSLTFL